MKCRFYKINDYNTCLTRTKPVNINEYNYKDYNEKRGYFKNKHKAEYVMLANRLEKEFDSHRRKKLIKRITLILDTYPEAVI